jgi:hypothetical protein
MTAQAWDAEGVWNACFGPGETRDSVLADVANRSLVPQDYARLCVDEAAAQGADYDRDEAYASLCRQLGVSVC